jgi:hypothetical protein
MKRGRVREGEKGRREREGREREEWRGVLLPPVALILRLFEESSGTVVAESKHEFEVSTGESALPTVSIEV